MFQNTKFYQDAIKTQAAQQQAEQQKKLEKLNRDYADTVLAIEAVLPDQAVEIITGAEAVDIENQRWLKSHDLLFKGQFGWNNNFYLEVTQLNPDPSWATTKFLSPKQVKNLSEFGQALLELEERRERIIEQEKQRQERQTKIQRIPDEWRVAAAKLNYLLRYLTTHDPENFFLDSSEKLLLVMAERLNVDSDYADQDYDEDDDED